MWRDKASLLDMLLAARQARDLCKGQTREAFLGNDVIQAAVFYWLTVLGEAARTVSAETRQTQAEIPWSDIIGLRNILVHQYGRVNPQIVWDIVRSNVPALIAVLESIVPPEESEA
jgi:uncharacterized protein with HEPN domain